MDNLAILSDVSQNIKLHLPQLECFTSTNVIGQDFLRIFTKQFDETLVFTSPVEIVMILKNSEELKFSLVSYKRELLEETTLLHHDQDRDTGQPTYILYLQKMLCDTTLVLCQGTAEENVFTDFGKIRKSDLVLCLIEKSVVRPGQLVFRARQCRTVLNREEVDTKTNLCRECTEFFSIFLRREKEAEQTVEEGGIKVCPFSNCGRTFRRTKPWENHLKSHKQEGDKSVDVQIAHSQEASTESLETVDISDLHSEVKCEVDIIGLDEVSPRKRGSLDHLFDISEKRRKMICNICNNSYLYEKAFHNHMKSHEKNQSFPKDSDLSCQHCNIIFQDETNFNVHMNEKHLDHLSCDLCPMKFTFKEMLEEHKTKDHFNVQCVACDINFDSENLLQNHNLEHHENSGDPCHICGKHVKRSSMANHVKMVHNGENMRKHLCNICGNAYKTKTDLDRHYTKHTGQKHYTCSTCGKSYRFWGGVDDCQRRHDANLRYACEKKGCGKGFNSKFRFQLHMRTHDGERPFQGGGRNNITFFVHFLW